MTNENNNTNQEMNKLDFYAHIKDGFFDNLTADLNDFKEMIRTALPVFGVMKTMVKPNEDGTMTITFIDEASIADYIYPEPGEPAIALNADSSTIMLTIHLNKNNKITIVEHNFGMFTTANKEEVLLMASLIGKNISFD